MKIITLIAVALILVLELTDALPRASVGGALTYTAIVLLAAVTLGLYDAWSQKRGVGGWLLCIVASFFGGLLGALMASFILDAILSFLALGVPLVETQHPMRYIASALMMLATLLGAWTALRLVPRR